MKFISVNSLFLVRFGNSKFLMSWTDIFPLMTDDWVEKYLNAVHGSTPGEIDGLFRVESTHNTKIAKHVVSTSLFCKPAFKKDEDFPPMTRELMQDSSKEVLRSRFKNPWAHYFLPILVGSKELLTRRPDIAFRVYLAKDLEFLVPELVSAGCEVFLMATSSIRHNPGAMWRFLAMEEDCLVTITDSDRACEVIHDVERTEEVAKSPLSYWRVPYFIGADDDKIGSPGRYRTTLACQFGATSSLPIRLLAESFVWSILNSDFSITCKVGKREIPIFGSEWPSYGFDEFFLNTVVFPRIATRGVVTFVPWDGGALGPVPLNHWFALAIEYCTWANRKSEIVFFGNSELEQAELCRSDVP